MQYLETNKTEDAVESWLQSINLNPKHVLAWTNLMALMDNTGMLASYNFLLVHQTVLKCVLQRLHYRTVTVQLRKPPLLLRFKGLL